LVFGGFCVRLSRRAFGQFAQNVGLMFCLFIHSLNLLPELILQEIKPYVAKKMTPYIQNVLVLDLIGLILIINKDTSHVG